MTQSLKRNKKDFNGLCLISDLLMTNDIHIFLLQHNTVIFFPLIVITVMTIPMNVLYWKKYYDFREPLPTPRPRT